MTDINKNKMSDKAKGNLKNYLKGIEPLKYVVLPFDDQDRKILDRIKNNEKKLFKKHGK